MIEKCANATKQDKILILTDINKKNIGESFFNYLLDEGYQVVLTIIKDMDIDGQEPLKNVVNMIENSDVIFYMTTYSLSHTNATKLALKNNAKVISMPNVEEDLIKLYIDLDYVQLSALTQKLTNILTTGNKVKILTDLGTNLELDIQNQQGIGLNGICQKGKLINLPDGESMIYPQNANGKLVIDGSMPPDQESKWGTIGKIKDPITITLKDGFITNIKGKKEANILQDILNDYGNESKQIAELGIGTNLNAKKITGNVTIDEKMYGTIHIAFGNSMNLGGKNNIPIHLDGVILNPTVYIDDKPIMVNGEILKY